MTFYKNTLTFVGTLEISGNVLTQKQTFQFFESGRLPNVSHYKIQDLHKVRGRAPKMEH